MSSANRIAAGLFAKHPQVVKRLVRRMPIQAGDNVCSVDDVLPTGQAAPGFEGRVAEVRAGVALVQWSDGRSSHEGLSDLRKVEARYEQPLPQLRTDFRPHDRVVLGNGDKGVVEQELVGPTGFYSFKVRVTDSLNSMAIGRRVYATANGMSKQAGMQNMYRIGDIEPSTQLHIGGITVYCEVAETQEAQAIGLQKISSLPNGFGMLFPYTPPKKVAFHMGAVSFPIDILFVRKDGDGHKVAKIMHNIQPNSPGAWEGPGEVSMVLEVTGGFCRASGIKQGTPISAIRKMAQEEFQPNREDNYPGRTYVPMEENRGDRFRSKDLGDVQLENNQAEPGHYEQQFGYDPVTLDNDPDNQTLRDTPAFRPSGHKVKP